MARQDEFIHMRPLTKKALAQLSRAIFEGIVTQAQVQMVDEPDADRETAEAAYQQARKRWIKRNGKTT